MHRTLLGNSILICQAIKAIRRVARIGIPVCILMPIWSTDPALADSATIYRCTQPDGTVVFSDKPCGPNATERSVEAPSAGSGSEENLKSEAVLAKQYDEEQKAKREAEARARAQQPPPEPPQPAQEPETIYVPSYVTPLYPPRPPHHWPYPRPPKPKPKSPEPSPPMMIKPGQ